MPWAYLILIPTHTGGVHGMLATWWEQNARSNLATSGRFASFWMSINANIENTVRYLGVGIDDAIALAERPEI